MTNVVSSCTPEKTDILADGKTQVKITAVIMNDSTPPAPQQGIDVTWAVTAGTANVDSKTSTTDATGSASTQLTATGAGNITVLATTTDDATGKTATLTATAPVTSNVVKSCSSDKKTLPADGKTTVKVTALVVDTIAAANPQSGIEVTWVASDSAIVNPPSSQTDASGSATTEVSTSNVGDFTVTATTAEDTKGQTVTLSATVVDPGTLEAPEVLNANTADQYTLDQYDIDFGVTATIPYFSGAESGQKITFYWGSVAESFVLDDPFSDLPYAIDVKNDMDPSCLTDGAHAVYYVVTDAAGNTSISKTMTVTVTFGGETTPTLPQPEVAAADPWINIKDATDGVKATVTWTNLAVNDVITLYWQAFDKSNKPFVPGNTSASFTISDPTVTSTEFPIDKSILLLSDNSGYEGTVNVYYTVKYAATGDTALSSSLICLVDTKAP